MTRWKKEQQEMTYRIYLTDALKVVSENTAVLGGKAIQGRYFDVINGTNQNVETRTKDDIINTMKGKLASLGGE